MRLVFMGTPAFAVPTLSALAEAEHDIAAVYTRAPAASGRGMALRPSPVQALAETLGLPVSTPRTLRGEGESEQFRALQADVAVVVAYGLILPEAILGAPRHGCLNLHGSLLPRWRGAAPMQRALMAGDRETGVMVMAMEAGLDTGPVALTERIPIPDDMTAGALHDTLAPLGAGLMARALRELAAGRLTFTPQPEAGVTYARKIDKAECRIDWRQESAAVHNQIRGLSPFPGAFFEAGLGRGIERVKVLGSRQAERSGTPGSVLDSAGGHLTVACGTRSVDLTRLQRAGAPALDTADFLRGSPLPPGLSLTAGL